MSLLLRCWGNDCVLYHPRSGNSHRLSAGFVSALEALKRGMYPLSMDDLVRWNIIAGDADDNLPTALEITEEIAAEFRALGLL